MTRNTSDLKALMTEYFRRAYDDGDATVIDELIAPNMICHGLSPEPTHARQEFLNWYKPFRAAFSNVSCKITNSIIEGDWICCRLHFTGTHTGDHLGPPASHKKVNLYALVLIRWQNGQAVEGFNEFNQHALLQQIGAA